MGGGGYSGWWRQPVRGQYFYGLSPFQMNPFHPNTLKKDIYKGQRGLRIFLQRIIPITLFISGIMTWANHEYEIREVRKNPKDYENDE